MKEWDRLDRTSMIRLAWVRGQAVQEKRRRQQASSRKPDRTKERLRRQFLRCRALEGVLW
jgi:hypothetical protein